MMEIFGAGQRSVEAGLCDFCCHVYADVLDTLWHKLLRNHRVAGKIETSKKTTQVRRERLVQRHEEVNYVEQYQNSAVRCPLRLLLLPCSFVNTEYMHLTQQL